MKKTISRILVVISAVFFTSLPSEANVKVELLSEETLELTWPLTGLEQELEISNDLAAESWAKVNNQIQFVENRYRVALPFDGSRRFFRVRQIIPPTSGISESSPRNGSGGVAVTRETVIRFNTPLSNTTIITGDSAYAEFGGERLAARSQLSPDRRTLTLFYEKPLPGGARIKIKINGDLLEDIAGRKIDADSDGNPGGIGTLTFNTLSLATIPGTAVVGQVLASELGMNNGAPVDTPLEGVMIFLDGKEQTVNAVTDADGNFKLEPVPGGEFFVHVYGRTAAGSDYPNGAYYATVGKAWKSIPGRDDTLAGGTGKIYLPLIQGASLQPVSSTKDTVITFMDDAIQDFPQLAGVSITVPANSLFDEDGTRGGMVGIAPVPPDRLPEPLPEGLNFPVVITVQTNDRENFDIPVPVRFPNLPDPVTGEILPPGAKTALWSFNHDSGRWELQGPMTISEDGLFAVSDPGVGITAPGWHGVDPDGDGDEGDPKKKKKPKKKKRNDDDGPDPDDPCDKERYKVMSAEYQCAVGILTAIPGFGYTVSAASGIVGSALDCYIDFDSCGGSIFVNLTNAAVGCIPGIGGALAAANGCLLGNYGSLRDYDNCLTSPKLFDQQSFSLQDGTVPPKYNGFLDQANLLLAAAEMYEVVYGNREWTVVDPEEWLLAEEILLTLEEFTLLSSDGGSMVSTSERVYLQSLPRPGNINEQLVIELIDRMEAIVNETLPSGELDLVALQAKAETLLDTLDEMAGKGWETTFDGLLLTIERISAEQNAQVNEGGSSSSSNFAIRADEEENEYETIPHLYFVVTNMYNGFQQRGQHGETGKFENIFLSADTLYKVEFADPAYLDVGITYFMSGPAGTTTHIPSTLMVSDPAEDTDLDGLTDTVETIIGTSTILSDTDSDGISDGAELENGTNPLDGVALPMSIVASIELAGDATDIAIAENIAVLARADRGVALIDVSDPLSPSVLSDIRIPGENSALVAAWGNRAISSGSTRNIAFININDPTSPVIAIKENLLPNLEANALTAYGPYGYIAMSTGQIIKVDMRSHDVLWTWSTGASVEDLMVTRGKLYALTASALQIYQDALEEPLLLGSIPVSEVSVSLEKGMRLFVGGNYAYYGYAGGHSIIDVSDPALPVLTGAPPVPQVFVHDLVTNGNNRTLAVTSFAGPSTLELTIYDGSDPTVVDQALINFDSPGDMRAVAMHLGLALVTDTAEDMQVINFLGQDTLDEAPTLTLETPFGEGVIEVENDLLTWLYVDAKDNHQIRSVELYLDGELVSQDGNFPFEFAYVPPPITETKSAYTAQVRASDMSGNLVFSDTLEINVVDTIPPIWIDFTPGDGTFQEADIVSKVSAFSTEVINAATLDANTFRLWEAGVDKTIDTPDDTEIIGTLAFDEERLELSYTLPLPLGKGIYSARIAGVSDLSGNVQSEAQSWEFEVRAPNRWIAETGGSWGVAANWSEGAIRVLDKLIIDVPGDPVTTTLSSGNYSVDTISSEENFTFSGGQLDVANEAIINGLFTWTGQSTFDGGGILWANGGLSISSSNNKFLDNLTLVNGGYGTWIDGSVIFGHLFSQLYNAEGATFEIANEGFVNWANPALDGFPAGLINDGSIIKNGPGEARMTSMPFGNNGSLDIREGEFNMFNSKFHGKGTVTVRSNARFTFEFTTDPALISFLEAPIHLEENATLGLEVAQLNSDQGVSITGNGNIEVKEGGQFGVGSMLEINGDISAKDMLITNGSQAILNGTTQVQTATLNVLTSVLGGSGLFEVAEEFIWTGGTMTGGGTTRLKGPLHMNQSSGQKMGERNLEIYGDVICEDGILNLEAQGQYKIHVMPGGIWTQQNDFEIRSRVGNGYFVWNFINEGSFIKEGDVNVFETQVNFENRGIMQLDSSFLRFDYLFSQTAEGTLNVRINGVPTQYEGFFSQIFTDGSIVLDGALNIQLAENFVPDIGASYRLLLGKTLTGSFATITGLEIAPDRKFEIAYNNKEAFLNVVAIP